MKTFDTVQEAIDYSKNNPSETVEYKEYYSNGQLWQHCFYVDGKEHGEFKSYYDNGQLGYHCFYVNGLYNGEYKSYYYGGQLADHCFYIDGKTYNVDHLKDSSYKSLCIKNTLFDGNVIDEDI